MAMAIRCAQTEKRRLMLINIILTMILGATFLVVKYFEYKAKWDHHLMPGPSFDVDAFGVWGNQARIFFSIYFAMTGLHAFHMVVGLGLMTWVFIRAKNGGFTQWRPSLRQRVFSSASSHAGNVNTSRARAMSRGASAVLTRTRTQIRPRKRL